MFHLLLAVLCSLAIGVIFKMARRFGVDRLGLVTVNYLAATLLALAIGVDFSVSSRSEDLVLLLVVGLANGALFIAGFGLYAASIDRVGLALSAATMRISVLVPFAASWFVWGEPPGRLQIPGLLLALVAFALMSLPPTGRDRRPSAVEHPAALLALLFVVAGVTDTALKVYDEHLAGFASRSTYLLLVFGGAFLAGMMYVLAGRSSLAESLAPRTLFSGVLLGLLNYGSVEYFLRALDQLPGTLAYPVNHVAVLLGGTLLGVAIWKEALTRANRLGLGLAAAALVLLTS